MRAHGHRVAGPGVAVAAGVTVPVAEPVASSRSSELGGWQRGTIGLSVSKLPELLCQLLLVPALHGRHCPTGDGDCDRRRSLGVAGSPAAY